MTERVTAAWPKVHGTGRMFDNEKALLVCFAEKPTDDELRAFDDAIKGRSPELSAAPQPSINAEMLAALKDARNAIDERLDFFDCGLMGRLCAIIAKAEGGEGR